MEPLRYCHRKWYLLKYPSLCQISVFRLPSFTLRISRLLSPSDFSLGSFRLFPNLDNCTLPSSLSLSFFLPWSLKTSARPISNDNLHALPRFQRRPIYLLVFQGSHGNLILVVGFTLRCFQRLSRPYFASQLCPWQDNCCTSGTSTPVLSY